MWTSLVLLLIAQPASGNDPTLIEHWSLQFAPDDLPELPHEVYGKTWGNQPPRTRLGSGHSDFLTFRQASKDKASEVELRHIRHLGFGKPDLPTVQELPLRIEKSLLEFRGELRTAVMHEDVLALNAGVPVGDRAWYLVGSETFTNGKLRVTEYLFEFAVDPRTSDRGDVTVKRAQSVFPNPKPETWEQAATFAKVDGRTDRQRALELQAAVAPGRPRTNLPKLLVWPDRPYLALDESNAGVVEYRLQK